MHFFCGLTTVPLGWIKLCYWSGPALYLLLAEGNGAGLYKIPVWFPLTSEFTCVLCVPLCTSRVDHGRMSIISFTLCSQAKFLRVGRGKAGLGSAHPSSGPCAGMLLQPCSRVVSHTSLHLSLPAYPKKIPCLGTGCKN